MLSIGNVINYEHKHSIVCVHHCLIENFKNQTFENFVPSHAVGIE